MFEINVKKGLEKAMTERKDAIEKRDALSDVKLLLDADRQEDANILLKLAPKSFEGLTHNKRGELMDIKKNEDEYGGEIYTTTQLKSMCIKYNMRFLSSRLYKGKMDAELATKVKHFCENYTKMSAMNNIDYNKFFILAPEELFMLKDKPVPAPVDPALFYKIDESHYRFVHAWGKDFTITRMFKGWMWRNSFNLFLVWFLSIAILAVLLVDVVIPEVFSFTDWKGINTYRLALGIVLPIVSFVFVRFGMMSNIDRDDMTGNIWNQDTKRNYF